MTTFHWVEYKHLGSWQKDAAYESRAIANKVAKRIARRSGRETRVV